MAVRIFLVFRPPSTCREFGTSATPSAFRLDLLHSDILSVIFSVFPTRVRLRVIGIVCRKWRRAIFVSLLRWAPSDGNLSLLARMPRLQELSLPPTASHFPSIDSFPTALHTLRVPQALSASSEELQPVLKLKLAHLQVDATWRFAFPLVLISAHCLRSLSIVATGSGPQGLYYKLNNVTLPSLTSLELLHPRLCDNFDAFLRRHLTSLKELAVVDAQSSVPLLSWCGNGRSHFLLAAAPLERLCVTVFGCDLATFTHLLRRLDFTALASLDVTVQGVASRGDIRQLALLRPMPTLALCGADEQNLRELLASPLASALASLTLVPKELRALSAQALGAFLPASLRATLRNLSIDVRFELQIDWPLMSLLLCSFTRLDSLTLYVGTADRDLAALADIVRVFVARCTPRVTAWFHRSVVVPPEILRLATAPCWTRLDVKVYA